MIALQAALASAAFSPGSIDGIMGPKTRAALQAFQQKCGLPATGELDAATESKLPLPKPLFTNYIVTGEDLSRLRPLGQTWLEKSQQDRLDYETLPELIAEKTLSSPTLIQSLNPSIDWRQVQPGAELMVPNSRLPETDAKAAFVRISLSKCLLGAYDDQTNLLAHFPCSIGLDLTHRPVGQLEVAVIIPEPNYTFDPKVFPESEEGRHLGRKLILQPGPNNPVGAMWIGLNKPGFGIHGSPRPEQVGRPESRGCFRLANWNAEFLAQLVWISMPVFVDP